jgi:hypothetical protein
MRKMTYPLVLMSSLWLNRSLIQKEQGGQDFEDGKPPGKLAALEFKISLWASWCTDATANLHTRLASGTPLQISEGREDSRLFLAGPAGWWPSHKVKSGDHCLGRPSILIIVSILKRKLKELLSSLGS